MGSFTFHDEDTARPAALLGPRGPFPRVAPGEVLERRWLHYAFLSRDGELGMVANACWLGPPGGESTTPRFTTILLVYERSGGWSASQFNASVSSPPWSAFAQPHSFDRFGALDLASMSGEPQVHLALARTSHPCTSQCAPFAGDQHLRWQSETGIRARGHWQVGGREYRDVDAIGYHERVRGRWGWPELGEWVFGFANDATGSADGPPEYAAVFTFIRPRSPVEATTASLMLWHRGRMWRHFPRRNVSMAVRGTLHRDNVQQVPALSRLFGVASMAPVPHRLVISARLGPDWAVLDFEAESAARVVIPSEDSLRPFSVHEVTGSCVLHGEVAGRKFEVHTRGIVEFAGGAGDD